MMFVQCKLSFSYAVPQLDPPGPSRELTHTVSER